MFKFIKNICFITIIGIAGTSLFASYENYGLKKVADVEKEKARLRNVAIWHFGAALIEATEDSFKIHAFKEEDDAPEYTLLSGDPSYSYTMTPGKHTYIVDLGNTFILEEFIIRSFSASGSVRISGSDTFYLTDSKYWKRTGSASGFGPDQSLRVPLGFLKAQYVLLEFDIEKAGDVSSISLIAPTNARSPDERAKAEIEGPQEFNREDEPLVPFNYAQLNEGARIAYVSSGNAEESNEVLNENFEDPYEFDIEDTESVMVIDLHDTRQVNGLNLLFESDPGTFTFLMVDELPPGLEEEIEGEEESSPEVTEQESISEEEDVSVLPSFSFLFHRPEPSALLVADEGSVGERMTLEDLGGFSEGRTFLNGIAPTTQVLQYTVSNDKGKEDEQVQLDFEDIGTRFVILVWTRDTNADIGPGGMRPLRLYQVNIIGDVVADELITNPISEFRFDDEGEGAGASLIDLLSTGDQAFETLNDGDIVINNNPPVVPPQLPSVSP